MQWKGMISLRHSSLNSYHSCQGFCCTPDHKTLIALLFTGAPYELLYYCYYFLKLLQVSKLGYLELGLWFWQVKNNYFVYFVPPKYQNDIFDVQRNTFNLCARTFIYENFEVVEHGSSISKIYTCYFLCLDKSLMRRKNLRSTLSFIRSRT